MSRTVDIKIKTTAENQGAEKTTKSLDTLDKKQAQVNKTSKASKQASVSASQGFTSVGQAASAASSGGIGSLSSALGGLSQQLPALASAAGPIGLVIAAFTAWKSVIDTVIKAQDDLKQNITSVQLGNTESSVKNLNESYRELTEQLSAASAELARFYNAESAGADAVKRAELAKLELSAAEARAKLDPKDAFASRRLELDVAKQKAAIEDAAAARTLQREQTAITQQKTLKQGEYSAAGDQRAALSQQAADLMRQQAIVTERAQQKAGSKWTSAGREEVWASANKDLTRIASELEKIKTAMQSSIKTQDRTAGELANLLSAADINRLNQSTRTTTQAAAGQGFTNTARSINYDQRSSIQAAQEAAQKQRDTIIARRAALQSTATKEAGDLRRARNSSASTESVKKELAEANKAAEAVAAYVKETSNVLRKLESSMAQQREALKNLPK